MKDGVNSEMTKGIAKTAIPFVDAKENLYPENLYQMFHLPELRIARGQRRIMLDGGCNGKGVGVGHGIACLQFGSAKYKFIGTMEDSEAEAF